MDKRLYSQPVGFPCSSHTHPPHPYTANTWLQTPWDSASWLSLSDHLPAAELPTHHLEMLAWDSWISHISSLPTNVPSCWESWLNFSGECPSGTYTKALSPSWWSSSVPLLCLLHPKSLWLLHTLSHPNPSILVPGDKTTHWLVKKRRLFKRRDRHVTSVSQVFHVKNSSSQLHMRLERVVNCKPGAPRADGVGGVVVILGKQPYCPGVSSITEQENYSLLIPQQ